MTECESRNLKDTFSLHERLLMQSGVAVFFLTGATAIAQENLTCAVLYVLLSSLGLYLIVAHWLCCYCPYPFKYSTCLFIPLWLVRLSCSFKKGRPAFWQSLGVGAVFTVIVAAPQFWLIHKPLLLLLFWISCLPVLAAVWAYYCPRCRNTSCSLNRTRCLDPELRGL